LPHVKIGHYLRFDVEELQGWIAQHRRDVKADNTADVAQTTLVSPYKG